MLKRAVFRLYRKARVILFQLLSNQTPLGPLEKVQAVQVMGGGRITALGGSMPFPVEIDFSTNMTCGGTTARH